ncbi:MAG: hypothetical protein KY455_13925 [Euryarchaeota archaeon]|nr:hypothetical protein [Euryarchaeota archaeon]
MLRNRHHDPPLFTVVGLLGLALLGVALLLERSEGTAVLVPVPVAGILGLAFLTWALILFGTRPRSERQE